MAKKQKSDFPNNGINRSGTKTVTGLTYSDSADLTVISGDMSSPLLDKSRLSSSNDSRIKRRIYFHIKTGDNLPEPDGSGKYAYIANISGLYDDVNATEGMREQIANLMSNTSLNEWESALLDAGYYGYMANGVGVFLDGKVKVKYVGPVDGLTAAQLFSTDPVEKEPIGGTVSKALPKPRKTRKTVAGGNSLSDKFKATTDVSRGFTDAPTSDVDSPKAEILDNIRSVVAGSDFSSKVAGKVAGAIKNFNEGAKDFGETHSGSGAGKIDFGVKKDTVASNPVEKLLGEIRNILSVMKTGTQKDIVSGQKRMQEIMEETKKFTPEIHAFFQKSVNDIFREINSAVKKKEEISTKETVGKKNMIQMNDGLTKFDPNVKPNPVGIEPDGKPRDFSIEGKTPEKVSEETPTGGTGFVLVPGEQKKEERIRKVKSGGPLTVLPKEEPVHPRTKGEKTIIGERPPVNPVYPNVSGEKVRVKTPERPPEEEPPFVREKPTFSEKVKPRRKDQRGRTNVDKHGRTSSIRPGYKEAPEEQSGFEKALGFMVNRKKDVISRNEDGSFSKTPSANKIGYTKNILRKGDEYLGAGKTGELLRKFRKKKPQIKAESADQPEQLKLEHKKPAIEDGVKKPRPPPEPPKLSAPTPEGVTDVEAKEPSDGGFSPTDLVKGGGKGVGGLIKGGARLAGSAALVAGAGYAGYKAGGWANDNIINPAIEKLSGKKDQTLGSQIYDWMHPDEPDWNKPQPGKKQIAPVQNKEMAKQVAEISNQAMDKDIAAETSNKTDGGASSVVNNTTNNTSPTQQIMPNSPMSMRPLESSWQRFASKRFGG